MTRVFASVDEFLRFHGKRKVRALVKAGVIAECAAVRAYLAGHK